MRFGSANVIRGAFKAPFYGNFFKLAFDSNIVDSKARTWAGTAPTYNTSIKMVGSASAFFSYTSTSIYMDDEPLRLNDFSIEMWYYPTTANQTNILFENITSQSDTTNFYISKIASNNALGVSTLGSGGSIFLVNNAFPQLNTWYHIKVARENGTWTLYLNDAVVDTSNKVVDSTATRYYVGAKGVRVAAAQYGLNGYIDDFKMVIRKSSYPG